MRDMFYYFEEYYKGEPWEAAKKELSKLKEISEETNIPIETVIDFIKVKVLNNSLYDIRNQLDDIKAAVTSDNE
jgi:hypothetical protein